MEKRTYHFSTIGKEVGEYLFSPELYYFVRKSSDSERRAVRGCAVSLLEHHNRIIDDIDRTFHEPSEFRCRHEYTKDDLIVLGLFGEGDFRMSRQKKFRLKGAEVISRRGRKLLRDPEVRTTAELESKLNKLYDALFSSEVLGRAINPSGVLERPEYLEFGFCGKIYEHQAKELVSDKRLLLLPDWRLFVPNAEWGKWPLIARDYRESESLIRREETRSKFDLADFGGVVMAESRDYGARKASEIGAELRDERYFKLEAEPHIPVSMLIRYACRRPLYPF